MTSGFPFTFYRAGASTSLRRRRLPHKEQRQVCYFTTFMAKDAFPRAAAERWAVRRRQWCHHHGLPANASHRDILNQLNGFQKRQFQRALSSDYHRALDRGAGECVLRDPALAGLVESAFLYHADRTCHLADLVVMPNHVHALLQPFEGLTLKRILQSIRKFSAGQLNRALGRSGSFWAAEPFDHMVRSRRFFDRYQQYIRANPRRAGLTEGEYLLREWYPP